jgi:hypothetical protein
MSYKAGVLSCIFLGVLTGCLPRSYSLTPIETRSTSIWLEDGVDFLVSKKARSVVIAAFAGHTEKSEFAVTIHATNDSNQNQKFIPDRHVQAFIIIPDYQTKIPLTVYSYDGYLELMERRHASAAAWNAVAQGLAIAAAGQGQSTSTTRANATYTDNTGYRGSAEGHASTTTTYTDPLAQQVAANRAERNVSAFNNRLSRAYGNAAESILRRTTLRPGEAVTGVVYIDDLGESVSQLTNDRLVLRVYVGEERHTLQFRRPR